MQENTKRIKLQKASAIALLCLFFAVFVGSIFCATILPFTDVNGVASADWIPSGDSNTLYVFQSLSQDFEGDLGLWFNLNIDCSSDSSYFDLFNSAIAWRGNASVYTNTSGTTAYRVGIIGYLYGYQFDYKYSGYYNVNSSFLTNYNKIVFPLAVVERFTPSTGIVSYRTLSTVGYSNDGINVPFFNLNFFTTRYLELLGASSDMRVVANYTLKNEGSYTLPVAAYNKIGGFVRFPFIGQQIGTGYSRTYQYQFQGYWQSISNLDSSYNRAWVGDLPIGLTADSVLQVQTLLSQIMSFGYKTQIMDSSESSYQTGYNNGVQDQKEKEEELLNDKYNQGFSDGKVNGYQIGYNEGKDVSSDYTFIGLLGAVFDAPIEAFKGLFNFEILGTNMQGFVLALLTLSVIIVVIKIALGGK